MISTDQVQSLLGNGGSVVDEGGDKIGSVEQVFLDDQTGEPEWATVKTGMFGGGQSFVPIAEASVQGDTLTVPYSKAKIKDAPRVDDSDGHLSQDQEAELYSYYGLQYSESASDSGLPTGNGDGEPRHREDTDISDPSDISGTSGTDAEGTVGRDTSGPTTDDAMTRSEERLSVGTEQREAGKAKLRKYVVTENVTTTVPVSREEVRLEREPITEGNADQAMGGGDITEEEHEVTLHEERPVVQKETVPVERVRLDKDTVTEQHEVSEDVRKEQIDLDQDQSRTSK